MKKYLLLITIFCMCQPAVCVQASSLDDLYRDIIRSDNEGYLPMFVKNRKQPVVLDEEQIKKIPTIKDDSAIKLAPAVKLANSIPEQEAAARAKQLKWDQTLKAVQQNQISPLELDEIYYRTRHNDPKAIEVLAWMYTKGVGVRPDYVEAYKLYQKAAKLNIPQANENASLIFKAMTETQRKALKGY